MLPYSNFIFVAFICSAFQPISPFSPQRTALKTKRGIATEFPYPNNPFHPPKDSRIPTQRYAHPHDPDEPMNLPSMASKTLSTLLLSAALTLPSAAIASINPNIYTGDYADPFHPLCERHIEVSTDGKSFHYSGTAVGPKGDTVLRGCSAEEQEKYGLRKGAFDGIILKGGETISAGDGIHEGKWEPAGENKVEKYGDKDGIRWNDGNKWVKL